MIFIDTHAHIFFKDFDHDRDDVVRRAEESGVAAIFDVGLDFETNPLVLKNAEKYPSVYPIIGFHPHEAKFFDAKRFKDFLDENLEKAVALGEFGLDYYRDHSPRESQRKVFEEALEMCLPLGKPLVFHCRAANDDMITMLRAAGDEIKGVMHCFSGGPAFLEQTLNLGMHISVGGPVTYQNSDRLLEVVRKVPLERLLLETDCPFLTPQFRRGKRNEPSYIPIIGEKIAEIRGIKTEELAAATTANVKELFGIPGT